MKAMILAAGKGERMRPLTLNVPKPLLEVGGKALIIHHIERLAENGFTDLVINHAWLGEKLEKRLGDGGTWGVNIRWSREGEPLETAGGIIHAMPHLQCSENKSSFVTVNADIWTDYSFKNLPEVDGAELLAWLVLINNPSHHPGGDFVLDNSRVLLKDGMRQSYTFSGIAVYHPALFEGVPAGKRSVVPLLKKAMTEGRVGGEFFDGQWLDIGTPERLQEVDSLLSQ